MTSTTAAPAPALKEIFNVSRFRHVAEEAAAVYPRFDSAAFLAHALPGLDDLTLMQRLRRMTESLHSALPPITQKPSPSCASWRRASTAVLSRWCCPTMWGCTARITLIRRWKR